MKTIEEEAKEYGRQVGDGTGVIEYANIAYDAVLEGIRIAQRWIPVEEDMPEKISTDYPQTNGNTLTFFENYIVKGYWNNEAKMKDVLMATYRTCSICWFFRVHKDPNMLDFTITHWRPIERK